MSTHEHTTHVCKDCGETKPISGFYVYKSGKPYTNCKVCRGKRGNEWRKQNPEKSRA